VPTRQAKKTIANSTGRLSATDRFRAALAAEDMARLADAAMELGSSVRNRLPEALRSAFDAVCDAFALYESGNDDAARERLQGVGLSSPFLDWKLLLRGLMAYAAGDDGRALDNWSRLTTGRLAARLAAPLRFALDLVFRTAHLPAVQTVLQRHGDRLVGGLVPGLRALQGLLARGRLADAFRQAETLLPELKRELPHAMDRLGECFRAAIIAGGEPEDIGRYRRVFGAPPDDSTLARLEALAAEDRHAWAAAHKLWQRFEQSVIDNPAWPAADRDRARALLWSRMGRNADDAAANGRRLQPNAEACFRKAIALAPDLLEPHEQLFLMLRDRNRPAHALAAGKKLLAKFPNHGPALETMARLSQAKGDTAGALEFARRSLAANPLDRRLRGRLGEVHRARARQLTAAGDLAAARAELDAALGLCDGRPEVGFLAHAAAVAFKAADTDAAEERTQQALAASRAAAAFALVAEAIRLKLPKPLKQRFDGAFAEALAGPPAGPAAVALATVFHEQRRHGSYTGQKGHEKKVQAFVEVAIGGELGEGDLVRLCERLHDLGWLRLLKKASTRGQKRFPRSPFFPYFEALVHMAPENRLHGPPTWKVEPLLEKARRLADAAPPDDAMRRLLRDLDAARRRMAVAAPVAFMLNELFDMFDED
jgi:tetratricopeptide (TPR) repeat protein